jgi:hypothetical protein
MRARLDTPAVLLYIVALLQVLRHWRSRHCCQAAAAAAAATATAATLPLLHRPLCFHPPSLYCA